MRQVGGLTGRTWNADPYYAPSLTTKGWRIVCFENGGERDLCGALNGAVAQEQCAILNEMRRLTTARVGR